MISLHGKTLAPGYRVLMIPPRFMNRRLNMRIFCTLLFCGLFLPLSAWDKVEKRCIASGAYGKMRVLSIDTRSDSLFLRQKARPVLKREIGQLPFAQLITSLLMTVTDPADEGVGIAAPQIGISRQVIAIQRFDRAGEPFQILVNPQILSYSGECVPGMEGCLSLPGRFGEVERPQSVVVEYNDPIDFHTVRETINGFTAVILQHEVDHLNGILFIDRMEPAISPEPVLHR